MECQSNETELQTSRLANATERFEREDNAQNDSLTLGCIWKVPLKCIALCVGTGDAGKGERQGGASDSQGERR
jgi:hypothetical protein